MTTHVIVNSSLAWNVEKTVLANLASINWQVRNSVNKTGTIEWALKQQVNVSANIRFNDLATVKNTPVPIQWKVLSSSNVTQNIYWRLGIDPNGPVNVTAAIKFNTLASVQKTASSQWKLQGRLSPLFTIWFNTLQQVNVSTSVQWTVGASVNSHIRQLAQERIDFIY